MRRTNARPNGNEKKSKKGKEVRQIPWSKTRAAPPCAETRVDQIDSKYGGQKISTPTKQIFFPHSRRAPQGQQGPGRVDKESSIGTDEQTRKPVPPRDMNGVGRTAWNIYRGQWVGVRPQYS